MVAIDRSRARASLSPTAGRRRAAPCRLLLARAAAGCEPRGGAAMVRRTPPSTTGTRRACKPARSRAAARRGSGSAHVVPADGALVAGMALAHPRCGAGGVVRACPADVDGCRSVGTTRVPRNRDPHGLRREPERHADDRRGARRRAGRRCGDLWRQRRDELPGDHDVHGLRCRPLQPARGSPARHLGPSPECHRARFRDAAAGAAARARRGQPRRGVQRPRLDRLSADLRGAGGERRRAAGSARRRDRVYAGESRPGARHLFGGCLPRCDYPAADIPLAAALLA